KAVVEALTGKFDRHTYNVNQWLNTNINITVKFIICDGSFVGGYYSPIFKRSSVPVVTIYHNYEVEFRKDNKSLESVYGLNIYWVKKLEKTSYNNSTLNLFITQSDLNIFCDNYGERQNNFVLGCYEFPKNSIKTPKSIDNDNLYLGDNIKLVISGSLNTVQSVDSIFWFLSSIYSLVADKKIELTLSGRKPSKEFKSKVLEYKNIKIIENPINMLDVLKDNHIYICPVNIGGGIKLRIMDALSLGLPSIIHTKSVRGYESFIKDGYMFEFHDLYSFEKSLELCKSKITNKKFSRINLIDKYNDIFSFNSGTARFH